MVELLDTFVKVKSLKSILSLIKILLKPHSEKWQKLAKIIKNTEDKSSHYSKTCRSTQVVNHVFSPVTGKNTPNFFLLHCRI